MRIDASGNVGIGTDTPLYTASGRTTTTINGTSTANLSFGVGGTGYGNIYVASNTMSIGTQTAANPINFTIGGATKATLDPSGNLLVGTTDTDPANNSTNSTADDGVAITAVGEVRSSRYLATANSGAVGFFNRTGTDGDIVRLRKSGTTVGSIGTRSSGLVVGSGDTGLFYDGGGDRIFPESPSGGAGRDAAIDLGTSNARFKDLYLSGGVYLGGTGTANKLDDYEEGTWTPAFVTAPSGTVASLTGAYTKVGNLVTVHVYITGTSLNISSFARISGLPFNAVSTVNTTGTYTIGGIANRNHGWTLLLSGTSQWYLSQSGGAGDTISASATYKV